MSFFASFYFFIKHKADKYNLVFTYFKKYESGGRIRRAVSKIMIFNMFLFMIVMTSLFSARFTAIKFYYIFGIIMTFGWTFGFYLCLKYWNTECVQSLFKGIRVVTKAVGDAKKEAKNTVVNAGKKAGQGVKTGVGNMVKKFSKQDSDNEDLLIDD